jgi:cysteine protease ATG4
MIPMRLGVEEFNPYYLDLLTGSLELSQSLGIIGGRPGKCFHIVGHQDKELFYLDPHVTKDPPPSPLECLITREFHTDVVLSMDPGQLDPSLLFGFLIRDQADLDAFLADLTTLNLKSPVFSFMP